MTVSNKNITTKETELRNRLQNALAEVKTWLDGKNDPAHSCTGDDFNRLAAKTGCAEDIDVKTPFNADFNSFIFPPHRGQNGFTNAITYGVAGLENTERLFAARCHELIHALQYQKSAALHADPYNAASTVILCPEDYILRKERLEQDAYVKGAWIASFALDDHPGILPALAHCPLPLSVFLEDKNRASGLQAAFHRAAKDCRNAKGAWINGVQHETIIADAWHERAAAEYERLIRQRLERGEKLTFARMTEKDMADITLTLGISSVDPKTALDFETLSDKNREAIKRLNALCGITDKKSLPSLGTALKQQNETRASFLKKSKNYRG